MMTFFRKQCASIYFDEQTPYHETGVLRKTIKCTYYINSGKEMDRINGLRNKHQQLDHKDMIFDFLN
jgi:hypothetical protein